MKTPLCNTSCDLEELENPNICCYWCPKHKGCCNPCRNLDCKAIKEIEYEDKQIEPDGMWDGI